MIQTKVLETAAKESTRVKKKQKTNVGKEGLTN